MKRIISSGKCGVSSGDLPVNGRRRRRAAKSALFAAGLLGVAAQRVHAQNAATWIGPNNSFWNIAANWDVGVVPNSGTTSVFIDGRAQSSASSTKSSPWRHTPAKERRWIGQGPWRSSAARCSTVA